MSERIERAYDPERFREQGHAVVDILADYLSGCLSGREKQVLDPISADHLWERWQQEGTGEGSIHDILMPVLRYANHLHHPGYAGHQVVPPVPATALAEMVSALLNNGMAVYEMGPSGTMLERETIAWLAEKCSLVDAGGFLTSGGTAGNLTALLAMRQARLRHDAWSHGTNGAQPAVMVSEQAHYSIDRAVRIMGWGSKGCVKIPTNRHFSVDVGALGTTLATATSQGTQVIGIIGSAGTTATGSYDDLEALADFAAGHGLWFHVDGAHGGAVVFSQRYRHLARGMERADSLVIDFHKLLLAPALATAVLFRRADDSYRTFSQEAAYLLDTDRQPWYDSAVRTLECTKKMLGLRVHVLRRLYGDSLFEEYIDGRYDMARRFATFIAGRPLWELATEPASNILCFRYVRSGLDEHSLNALNESIREHFRSTGRYYIVRTSLQGITYLRMTIMNPFTGEQELNDILTMAESWANEHLEHSFSGR